MAREDKIVRNYFGAFAGILDRSGIVQNRSGLAHNVGAREVSAGDFSRRWDEPNGILFVDGSYLTFIEKVAVVNGEIEKVGYTYRFASHDGHHIFRFDKDGRSSGLDVWRKPDGNTVWHPAHHLHIHDEEEPRYKTHETTLEEILTFIRMCFVTS